MPSSMRVFRTSLHRLEEDSGTIALWKGYMYVRQDGYGCARYAEMQTPGAPAPRETVPPLQPRMGESPEGQAG